jgi:hypothetical protein
MENEILKYFFKAYFHQDWRSDYSSSFDAVQNFIEHEAAETRKELKAALHYYLLTQCPLTDSLIWELGGSFRPSAEGRSTEEWFREVAERL